MRTTRNGSSVCTLFQRAASTLALMCFLVISGCSTAKDHQARLASAQEREMTVGIVQREIRVGMSQADVATALGSPNIVTRDVDGKETWVYDKVATEASYSQSGGGAYATLVIVGVGGSQASGATSVTQKTLTVVIKFDTLGKVASFTYRSSKF